MASDTHERTNPISRVRTVIPGPNDIAQLSGSFPRAVYLSATADISVMAAEDSSVVTLVGMVGGMWHPMACRKITAVSTGTAYVGY